MATEPDGKVLAGQTLDDLLDPKQDTDRQREIRYFPWFGGLKVVHYYVMKDKE